MRRTSTARRKRAKRQTEGYADSRGIRFDEYHFHLPAKVSDWQTVVRVDDARICSDMHEWFKGCWACCWDDRDYAATTDYELQAHHITGGTKGRSDEYSNIAMLCMDCHGDANTNGLPMGRILFLKWKFDRQHTDWVRLALLARRFLPGLFLDNGETWEG
jgi:5-methylcytosine-specific restriction endonuclease McrA